MRKSLNWVTLAGTLLLLTACGGSANNPGGPNGPLPDPQSCRETLSGVINIPKHLHNHSSGCDYFVTGRVLDVEAKLTAAPGTVIAVDAGTRIVIGDGGSIDIEGTADQPVTFTGSVPEQGSWEGFCFTSGHAASQLARVHVLWAGNNPIGVSSSQCRGAIGSMGYYAPVSITDSIVFGSATTGIEAARMQLAEFRNNRLAHHGEYGIRVGANNISRLDPETDYAGDRSVLPDGTVTPNGLPYVYVASIAPGTTLPGEHTWRNLGVPYHVTSDTVHTQTGLPIGEGSYVSIEPGVTLLMGGHSSISVEEGAMIGLFGTAADPVIITADSPEAEAGHWDGIKMRGGGIIARNAEISFGGAGSGISQLHGNLGFFNTAPLLPCSYLENTRVTDSATHGINIDPTYSDVVHIAASVDFMNNAEGNVNGTAAGPVVTTFDEALACMN